MEFDLNFCRQQYSEQSNKIFEDFFTFLKFQTISTESSFKEELLNCSVWLSQYLKEMGFEVEVWKSEGHPIIFASLIDEKKNKPTLLIYNHYDVQPVDPLELWDTPPFEPIIKEGKIFARGASDNKGQCFYVLSAIKMYLSLYGSLPINLKLCIEGEEEAQSKSLTKIVSEKKKALKADYCLLVDVHIPDKETPAITLGTRGIFQLALELTASNTDLHSGSHGGIVFNPIHALVSLLSQMRDTNGKITVPGFYDDVKILTEAEKKELYLDFDIHTYEKQYQTKANGGESEFSPIESVLLRPTFEINGIKGGYIQEGFKTVIPAKASAKISCRLVPDQDPQKLLDQTVQYLKSLVPSGIDITFELDSKPSKALRCDADSHLAQVSSLAYESVFKQPCRKILAGGSIPIATALSQACGAEFLLMGVGLDTDNIHAPNEHMHVELFEKGLLIMMKVINLLGKN